MSRRPTMPSAGAAGRNASRMALGGRLSSEARIRPHWHPVGGAPVGDTIDIPIAPAPEPGFTWGDFPAGYTWADFPVGLTWGELDSLADLEV